MECRLYAEDPWRDHLPSPGRVLHLDAPEGPGIRFDSGIATGSEVSTQYDPLLAKVITWGRDRTESIERMAEALTRTAILGVTTNLALLRAIVAHPRSCRRASHRLLDDNLSDHSRPNALSARSLSAALAFAAPRRRRRGNRKAWEHRGPGGRLAVGREGSLREHAPVEEGKAPLTSVARILRAAGDAGDTIHCVRDATHHLSGAARPTSFEETEAYRPRTASTTPRSRGAHAGKGSP